MMEHGTHAAILCFLCFSFFFFFCWIRRLSRQHQVACVNLLFPHLERSAKFCLCTCAPLLIPCFKRAGIDFSHLTQKHLQATFPLGMVAGRSWA